MTKANCYAIHQDDLILGVGATSVQAWRDALDGLDPQWNLQSAVCGIATEMLVVMVRERGGDIEWDTMPDGVACTRAEFDEAMGVPDGELLL